MMIPNRYTNLLISTSNTNFLFAIMMVAFSLLTTATYGQTCEAEAGTLGTLQLMLQDESAQIMATPNEDAVTPDGFNTLFVLTSGEELVIEEVSDVASFTVPVEGTFTIHTLVYDPTTLDLGIIEFGETTGFTVNSLLIQGGGAICAALDVPGARFIFGNSNQGSDCTASSGTLMAQEACIQDGTGTLEASIDMAPVVPEGFELIYVLTSGEELVIEQVSDSPIFDVTTEGVYTIHTLVYDPTTLDLGIVEFGVTTGFDVNGLLEQGGGDICAALDVAGAPFDLVVCEGEGQDCAATFGSLVKVSANCIDVGPSSIKARVGMEPTVPDGFEVLYVLTSGEALVIEQVNEKPIFSVDRTGSFTIHTLVYNPNTLDLGIIEFGKTTGFDVNGLLEQGGGDICAALDVEGANFHVGFCLCRAEAGTLKPDFEGCLTGGGEAAKISAKRTSSTRKPSRFYKVQYVLTSGNNLVIEAINDKPEFHVLKKGTFRIHTLVYNFVNLDLGVIEFGKTTGGDVLKILEDPAICGDLDVEGAKFEIDNCTCDAAFGALMANSNDCFTAGHPVKLEAAVTSSPTVPEDFEVIYVLTKGDQLVIQATNDKPSFEVETTGDFRIHTLVYNPATLDLGIVEPGKTTGVDVNNLLIQGGGQICAVLDVAGALFKVEDCPCEATSGTLSPDDTDCLVKRFGSRVKLVASKTMEPIVPKGYKLIYVLTRGEELVIEQTRNIPEFFVYEPGRFTIHTLVYNPETLDLGIIEAGKTTGVDVNNLLIQGGGDICAALDVAGAPFEIVFCETGNLNASPTIYPNPTTNQLNVVIPQGLNDKEVTINILDRNGNILATQELKPGTDNTVFDLSNVINGVYAIRFQYGNAIVKQMLFSKFD